MTPKQLAFLNELVEKHLDDAQAVWEQVGPDLTVMAEAQKSLSNSLVTTRIPGYPIIQNGVPQVDEFIALVADLRDSTGHLLQAISLKTARVSQLQRVYYETSALLPCLAQVIEWQKGAVTEYLGDGVLALFRASAGSPEAVYAANRAARGCLEARSIVINPQLMKRYKLPEIDIRIGMAHSKAVVTLVGLDTYKQPKVFGECVWRATKLAQETNEIVIDDNLKRIWPKSEGGPVSFRKNRYGQLDGYLLLQSS